MMYLCSLPVSTVLRVDLYDMTSLFLLSVSTVVWVDLYDMTSLFLLSVSTVVRVDLYDMMALGMKFEGWFTELDEYDIGNEDKNTLMWMYKPCGKWNMIKCFFFVLSMTINDKKRRELRKALKGGKKAFVSN
jgi:hypothetical protein